MQGDDMSQNRNIFTREFNRKAIVDHLTSVWQTNEQTAEALGMIVATVAHHTNILFKQGWLTLQKIPAKRGKKHSYARLNHSEYILPKDPSAEDEVKMTSTFSRLIRFRDHPHGRDEYHDHSKEYTIKKRYCGVSGHNFMVLCNLYGD